MSWLDIVIVAVLAISAFFGLKAGLIKAVLSLAGMIIGVILAGHLHVPLSEQLTFIARAEIAKVVAFVIILLGVMIVAAVLARFLKWVTSLMMLGWVNHLGGAAFGLALGSIFCAALLATWVKWLGVGETIAESIVAPVLLDKLPLVLAFLPDEFSTIRDFFQ